MTAPVIFPGGVFDAEGVSLIPGRPDLVQGVVDAMPVRSMVGANSPTGGEIAIGRVWLLHAGATLTMIAPAERQAARAIMREGMGILLLAPDALTEARMRNALLEMQKVDETPQGRFGHA